MRTAFATWDNRIAPVFDTAREICVVETEKGRVVSEHLEALTEELPVQKALQLVALGVDGLVCGAISTPLSKVIAAYGIRLLPFVAGDLHEVIHAWLAGKLEVNAFAMPGCCGWGRRRRPNDSSTEGFAMNIAGGGGMRRGGGQGQGGGRTGQGGVGKGPGTGRQSQGGAGKGQGGGRQGQGGGGQRRGRMGGGSAGGPGGTCVCPSCGHSAPHERGVPCTQKQCPKCGTPMQRQ